ncbi:Pycsar system effector family protein [Lysinibacillus sp. LZ02]|uniref:Pycsar system effector family protein n=1 Tax=Lysinibacillus sp. LZ02 TaxID=3420668 RepID=UPI003D36A54E
MGGSTITNNLEKDNLLERLDRLLDWIKSCDTKASIGITAVGIFLTIFLSEKSLTGINKIIIAATRDFNFSNLIYLLLIFIAALSVIYGGFNLISVLVPRLNSFASKISGTRSISFYYFGSIANGDYDTFKQKIQNETEDDEIEDILSQIYINSKICDVKFRYYKKGIIYSFSGIVALILLYVIGFLLLKLGGF